jgi:hypothetical protein
MPGVRGTDHAGPRTRRRHVSHRETGFARRQPSADALAGRAASPGWARAIPTTSRRATTRPTVGGARER